MADQRVLYTEEVVGAGHPTKADTVNRLALVEHNNDGTHKKLTQVTDPWVDVRAFGTKGDGVADDTTAIKNAIAALPNGGILFFPKGIYLCGTQLVPGTTMPEGITFLAQARGGNDAADGTVIKYTGANICFDIRFPNGTAEAGQWVFENLTFQTTNVAGGMFQFNDITITPTNDATTPYYIRGVEFRNCVGWGAGGGATQAGNFIQGVKTFHLHTDEQCYFRGWKRAIYLKGCDNNLIQGRFVSNVRHIHLERGGTTFGNGNKIDSRFLGACVTNGVETAYQVYDSAYSTSIHEPWLEGGTPGMLYLDGQTTAVYRPWFSASGETTPNNVAISVGPNMVDAVIYGPQTTGGSGFTIAYATPATWYWRGTNQLGKLIIVNPSRRFETYIITPHPRLKVVSEYDFEPNHQFNGLISANGSSLKEIHVTPFTVERCTYSGGNFINNVIADTSGYRGYAIELAAGNVTNSFCLLELVVGKDIQNGETINLTARYKQGGTLTTGTTRYIIMKNGANVTNGALTNSTSYTTATNTYTLSGFVYGDKIQIGIYNTADVTAVISSYSVRVTQAAIADTTGAALAALETEVNKLKASLRTAGVISV